MTDIIRHNKNSINYVTQTFSFVSKIYTSGLLTRLIIPMFTFIMGVIVSILAFNPKLDSLYIDNAKVKADLADQQSITLQLAANDDKQDLRYKNISDQLTTMNTLIASLVGRK